MLLWLLFSDQSNISLFILYTSCLLVGINHGDQEEIIRYSFGRDYHAGYEFYYSF